MPSLIMLSSLTESFGRLISRTLIIGLKKNYKAFFATPPLQMDSTSMSSLLNQFFDEMTPLTSWRPWMVGLGNHDANCEWSRSLTVSITDCYLQAGVNGDAKDKAHNITYTIDICALAKPISRVTGTASACPRPNLQDLKTSGIHLIMAWSIMCSLTLRPILVRDWWVLTNREERE